MIVDKVFRQELGRKAQQFVRTHWNHKMVAKRYLELIEDNVLDHWWCDPQTIGYVYGCGLPKAQAVRVVRAMIQNFGVKSLQVSDKPNLEKAFIDLASKQAG
jgi:hypothetical protein